MKLETINLLSFNLQTKPINLEQKSEYSDIEPVVKIDFDVSKDKEKPVFMIPMNIVFQWDEKANSTYSLIEIRLIGLYSFPTDTTEEKIRPYVPTLCLVNLYSEARGIVSLLTSLCPDGPYFLPLVDMNEVVREKHNNIKKVVKPKKVTTKKKLNQTEKTRKD